MQETDDGVAQVVSIDRIDERAWIGAGKRLSVLADDMSVNHPAAVLLLGDKLIAAALGNSRAEAR